MMKPRNAKPKDRTTQEEFGSNKRMVARATRHDLSLPFRYRLQGRQEWRTAETINISNSGLLFFSDEILEVNAKVEIIFQISGIAPQHASTYRALVVRRVLSNWPDTHLVFAARFDA